MVEFSEVKQLLRDALGSAPAARLARLGLVHVAQVLDFRLGDLQLRSQVLHAVVRLLLLRANHADEGTLLAAEDNHGALLLVRKQLFIGTHFLTALLVVDALKQ